MPNVNTKRAFFDLWQAGVLGNRLRVFNTAEEAIAAGLTIVGFRELGRAGGGLYEGATNPLMMLDVARRWTTVGKRFIICEGAPDHFGLMQGELCRTYRGLEGFITVNEHGKGVRMRRALNELRMQPLLNMQVIDLLNRYMDPASRDDIDALFDLYPDAAIEFTSYSCRVGHIPGRKTIIWEVRNY